MGRFLQKDPEPGRLSLPVTVVNSYAYAGNSPLKLTYPSGRSFLGDLILGVLITAVAVFTAGFAAQFMVGLFSAAGTAFAPVIGAVSGAISGGIAGGIVGAVGYGVQGRSAAEGFVAGMIQGAIAGAVAGAVVGANMKAPGGNKSTTTQPERSVNSTGEINTASDSVSAGDGVSASNSTRFAGQQNGPWPKVYEFAHDVGPHMNPAVDAILSSAEGNCYLFGKFAKWQFFDVLFGPINPLAKANIVGGIALFACGLVSPAGGL